MITRILIVLSSCLLASCASLPKTIGENNSSEPDYQNLQNWAAHPEKSDPADRIPGKEDPAEQINLPADIFFIHPTTYTKRPIDKNWNAPVNDEKLNERTDNSTILYQASIFNQAGRVFAPRYRQAHIKAYYNKSKNIVKRVFDIAYHDVKTAFQHYLKHYNKGRPFIIASHSQGTTHGKRLISELIDDTQLEFQMIAAYLIGMPVPKNSFKRIRPCEGPKDLTCFVSWRTFKTGHIPDDRPLGDSIAVHNPLSWTMDESYISKEQNKGAVIRKFDRVFDKATDAQINNGLLWAAKPKFPMSFLFTRKDYHIADLNFYYMNVAENANDRVNQYLRLK